MKERHFRVSKVIPFLKTLKNTYALPIQQVAISGSPDFILCSYGKFVALELKKSGGRPRALQKYILDQISKCGGRSIVASPDNWESIKQELLRLDQKGEI